MEDLSSHGNPALARLPDPPQGADLSVQRLTKEQKSRLSKLVKEDTLTRLENMESSGKVGEAGVNNLIGLLETRGESGLVDQEVTGHDMLDIVEDRGDLSETLGVTKPQNVVPVVDRGTNKNLDRAHLERGKIGRETPESKEPDEWVHDEGGAGWAHIEHNRLHDQGKINEFERKFGEEYSDPEKVKQLIMTAVKKGEVDQNEDGKGANYVYSPDGENYLTVVVGSNGFIVTAYPGDQR